MTTDEATTLTIPANRLMMGDTVVGFRSVPDREVASVHTDQWGTWVTYTDGVRDSFPPAYKVCVVIW